MAEGVFVTRSAGIGCTGVEDQYADGRAARAWELMVGGQSSNNNRTRNYKQALVQILRQKRCRRILDVACGTGVDSVMLLEEGFDVTSIDASDKMLKHALKKRWQRRKEEAFDKWVIEEANWLTLADDLEDILEGGFDAVICLGNSFAHLVEINGDQSKQHQALKNFEKCVRPGGLLIIDHRNFDSMLDHNNAPLECIYYQTQDEMVTSVLYTSGHPVMVTLDYKFHAEDEEYKKDGRMTGNPDDVYEFRLSYYPHRLEAFSAMLRNHFPGADHRILADYKPSGVVKNPGFYIHILEKTF